MHESVIAESLLSAILAEAAKQKGKPVSARISCGVLNAVNDEVLNFAFDAIAKGTVCEGLELAVEHKPIQGRCRKCGGDFEFDISRPKCSVCGAEDFELLADEPLTLETIEFEVDGNDEKRS